MLTKKAHPRFSLATWAEKPLPYGDTDGERLKKKQTREKT
jgi:hypothetical protein